MFGSKIDEEEFEESAMSFFRDKLAELCGTDIPMPRRGQTIRAYLNDLHACLIARNIPPKVVADRLLEYYACTDHASCFEVCVSADAVQ